MIVAVAIVKQFQGHPKSMQFSIYIMTLATCTRALHQLIKGAVARKRKLFKFELRDEGVCTRDVYVR